MSKNPPVQRTLADIIMEKLTEKKTEIQSQMSGEGNFKMYMPPVFVSFKFSVNWSAVLRIHK